MSPGTLLHYNAFSFKDGEVADKYLVVLANDTQVVVAATITSQGKWYGRKYGCQLDGRFPCFHLPVGSCCLPKPSWICLNAVYDLDVRELLQARMEGRVVVLDEPLTPGTTIDLLRCAVQSEDITPLQEEMILAEIQNLCPA